MIRCEDCQRRKEKIARAFARAKASADTLLKRFKPKHEQTTFEPFDLDHRKEPGFDELDTPATDQDS